MENEGFEINSIFLNIGFSLVAAILLGLVLFSFLVLMLHTSLGVDQYWCMYAAGKMLSGVPLDGSRLVESNPPLFVWFALIPTWLANLTHISYTLAYELCSTILAVLSSLACCKVVRAIVISNARVLFPCLALLVGAVELFLLQRRPGELSTSLTNFGQKEYFVVVCLLPYILGRAGPAMKAFGPIIRVAIGIGAGIAICLKPYQVLAILLFELVFFVRDRRPRALLHPEVVAMVLTCGFYPLVIEIFCPRFMNQVLPLMIDTYWGMGTHTTWFMVRHQDLHNLIACAFALVAWMMLRNLLSVSRVSLALLLCATGSSLAYDLQHTGWAYQQLPAWAFWILAVAWIAIDAGVAWSVRRNLNLRIYPVAYVSVAVLVAMLLSANAERLLRRQMAVVRSRQTIASELDQCTPTTAVYLLSTGMPPFQTLLNKKLIWSSRFAHLWMLPAIAVSLDTQAEMDRPFRRLSNDRLSYLEATLRNDIATDLNLSKPRVIFVDRFSPELPPRFDTLHWFLQDQAFAEEWSHYSKVKTVANSDGSNPNEYDEYVRSQE